MRTKNVVVLPYDFNWSHEFEKIKICIEKELGDNIIGIEHVGSTSIEGLAAKPIIDLDVIIESYDNFEEVKAKLETLGYYHEGDLDVRGREAFAYDENEKMEFMTHHLYVCPKNSDELNRHITFRNYMRTSKEDVEKYSAIKLQAAKLYPKDIDSYCEYKSPCIIEIYKKIGLEN
ncbi:GrpB family protein [Clostridium sp. YIM B02555]|uniref:GrpB family protein n=1 Tax=Clostridium sp. YIM B02555 TaxID=2911968 RepID=UPI001EEE7B19|nr:GrpB family protein [Clostridium sp. YIM B02555]